MPCSACSRYSASGDHLALERALLCGDHLLAHRSGAAWLTIAEVPLAGFSHGAAGIAYALVQLHAATDDARYRDAALAAMAYECDLFSFYDGNWPDLRVEPVTYPVHWCHGAAGIGLARIGCLSVLDRPELRRDGELALDATARSGVADVDHLCCGNFGRVETLLAGARALGRPADEHRARAVAATVVRRAAGGYRLFSNLPASVYTPSFYRGTSGIAYQLLRLADPSLPSILLWQ